MDKKNTMLLTVIAVATLLVAVVGATFAYFSIVSGTGGSTKTDFQGQVESTDDVGLATLKGGTANLYMYLTAADMSKANAGDAGKSYWATTTVNNNESNKSETEESSYYEISTLEISKISRKSANYKCTSTLNIKGTGALATYVQNQDNPEPKIDEDQKVVVDDGIIKLRKSSTNDEKVKNIKFDGTADSEDIDLLSVLSTADGRNVTVTYELTSSSEIAETETITAKFEAALGIKNTINPQNYLAGKDLTLTLTNTLTACDIVTDFGE